VVQHWRDKDYGIWEVRDGPHHFVYSKVMCWVALDRGIKIARRYGFFADLKNWANLKREIKEEVLKKGWNEEKKTFVQHYDTDAVDASALLIPLVGFLPFNDQKILSTVAAVEAELVCDGLVYRYRSSDGLTGEEGHFLLCSFWYIDNLVEQGRIEEAERHLARLESIANHLGLYSEEFGPRWNELLGNFPQAFTHIGYINSVVSLCRAKNEVRKVKEPIGEGLIKALFPFRKFALNEGTPVRNISSLKIATELKKGANVLRGAFFDTEKGRVAYEEMEGSPVYRDFVILTRELKRMDLFLLKSREERLAFWINLFNVMVIHGVIHLGIRDSVKEVWNFFRRIRYQVGDFFFTPDDIEHGILRGNRAPPYSIFSRQFRGKDPRGDHIISQVDPRIHFAAVCASNSCPPIGVYTPGNIDEELEIAAQASINGGMVKVRMGEGRVYLSKIFSWYEKDFGRGKKDVLKFVAPYLYDDSLRHYLLEHIDRVDVLYQEYDWRLNR
jgi:hypothetical protein